jgi:hypothetical protein
VGAIEVAAPVFTEAHGSPTLAGLALSASGLGSVLGGVVLARQEEHWAWPPLVSRQAVEGRLLLSARLLALPR